MAKTSLDLGEHRQYKKLGFIHHTTPPTPIEIDAIFKPHSGTENGKDFGNYSGKLSCPGLQHIPGPLLLVESMPNIIASKAWKV